MANRITVIITGLVIGLLALVLSYYGNPANMGMCIACFLRDLSGGLGLHQAAILQYARPEIMGMVLGAFVVAFVGKEFSVKGGSSTLVRFVLGIFAMVGMLIFLGCPLRVALRLGAGDLNAFVGFAGLFVGVGIGTWFLKTGFTFPRATAKPNIIGYVFPMVAIILVVLVATGSSLLYFSSEGPGSMHAPVMVSLVAGLIVGVLAQRSRFCMAGGIRDLLLFRNYNLIIGFLIIIAVVLVGSLLMGKFNLGFEAQPIAHADALWNFLGLALAGWCAAILGGCPLRQLILGAQGNLDSVATVLGLMCGAALSHIYGFAASPKGVPVNGMYAAVIGFVVVLAVSVAYSYKAIQLERREQNENCGC